MVLLAEPLAIEYEREQIESIYLPSREDLQNLWPYMTDAEQAELAELLNSYEVFRLTYFYDPAAFVQNCLDFRHGEKPAFYQLDMLTELVEEWRLAVRGLHGLGKTACVSWAILWFALTRDIDYDWKIPTTASVGRQLTRYLWPEIHKWTRQVKWDKVGRPPLGKGELLQETLRLNTGEAFALVSNDPELLEGAHADQIMYVFDESKNVADEVFDSAEGAFSSGGLGGRKEAYAMAISTPGEPAGRFYDIHRRAPGFEDWAVKHVTKEEAIQAGRVSEAWIEQRRLQWGEESPVFQNRVLGEFAENREDQLIPLAWIEAANERWHEAVEQGKPTTFTGVGADVGGGGVSGDKSILADLYADFFIDILLKRTRGDPDTETMIVAGLIKARLDAKGGVASIDVIGIGTGIIHRLREQGTQYKLTALAFNASQGASMRDKTGIFTFRNVRSAGWWTLREALDPLYNPVLALPPDDDLTGDLTTPKFTYKSNGVIQVESKDDIKGRLKRSTDCGDAVMMIVARHLARQSYAISVYHGTI